MENVTRRIVGAAPGDLLIVEKSTVPANTGAWIERNLAIYSGSGGRDVDVASNPEFLREGSAVHDYLHSDLVVVGVKSARTAGRLRELYAPIFEGQFACPFYARCAPRDPFLVTNIQSAEMIKHASNAFPATKILFINAVADLCERVGADVAEAAEGMRLDVKIGGAFLQPGLGFGGSCFPRDLLAFLRLAEEMGLDFGLLWEVDRINRGHIDMAVERLRRTLWIPQGKRIGLLGIAFKPYTDDVRQAPALAARPTQEGGRSGGVRSGGTRDLPRRHARPRPGGRSVRPDRGGRDPSACHRIARVFRAGLGPPDAAHAAIRHPRRAERPGPRHAPGRGFRVPGDGTLTSGRSMAITPPASWAIPRPRPTGFGTCARVPHRPTEGGSRKAQGAG